MVIILSKQAEKKIKKAWDGVSSLTIQDVFKKLVSMVIETKISLNYRNWKKIGLRKVCLCFNRFKFGSKRFFINSKTVTEDKVESYSDIEEISKSEKQLLVRKIQLIELMI
ncbi:hypothetical protein BpHYR1_006500 [Brachionus plicatilis]|uniref:Uncharacterized protein n=1 Tax=Brachionus plicatilis TaxID=10195 RepID=A0A3M7Q432_BRAPC|nr:hypothetical protein BpHYR1_006500 [Brachionus plicatilis]